LKLPKFIKTEDQKNVLIIIGLYIGFTLLVPIYEHKLIPSELIEKYFIAKAISIFGSLPFFILLLKNPLNQLAIFGFTLITIFYSASGEYFSPLYYIAYIECVMAIIIFLRPKRFTIYPILLFGSFPTIYIQYLKEIKVITHARSPVVEDFIMISLVFTIIFILMFEGYSKRRRKEIEYRERFSLIGENVNSFAHNIKSILSSLFIISDNLKEEFKDEKSTAQNFKNLDKILDDIHLYLNQFNTLAKVEKEKVSIKESIMSISKLLRINESNIIFEGDDIHLKVIKQDIETILLNIFSNFKKSINNTDDSIRIKIKKKEIIFSRNFSKAYKTTSGIGQDISQKIAYRNNMELKFKIVNEKSISTIKIL
jgi:hypothetical protein